MFSDYVGKEVVIFYDDGGKENNIRRREGIFSGLYDNFIVFEEESKIIVMPLERIIRIEII